MKKVMSFALASSMALSLMAAQASAAAPAPDVSAMSVKQLAYMDTETASPALEEAILDARAEIIYGDQSWTVDGAITLVNADGTEENLPEFSELFPGWDIPESEAPDMNLMSTFTSTRAGILNTYRDAVFPLAQVNVPGRTFFTHNVYGEGTIGVYALTSPEDGARYNIGVTNYDGEVGWLTNIPDTKGAKIAVEDGQTYVFRGSAPRSEWAGDWRIGITSDIDAMTDFLNIIRN